VEKTNKMAETQLDLKGYEAWMKIKRYSNTTISYRINYLKLLPDWNWNQILWLIQKKALGCFYAVLNYAYYINDQNMIAKLKNYTPRRQSRRFITYLKKEEYVELIEKLKTQPKREDLFLLIWFIFKTGLRIRTAIAFKMHDIDPKDLSFLIQTKNRVYVRGYVPKSLYDSLIDYCNRNKIRPTQRIFKRSYDCYYKLMRKVGNQILGKNIHPHMLRHSFGVYLYEKEKDINLVAWALGHSKEETALVYTKKETNEYMKTAKRLSEDE
jgi:integrase